MTHSFTYVTWLIRLHMWHDSFIYICDMTHLCAYVTWLIHLHMWHDSFVYICDMTHSFTYVTWLIHLHMWHDSFTGHFAGNLQGSIRMSLCVFVAWPPRATVLRGWTHFIFLSFFLSWVSKTHPNYWTKRMENTWLVIEDPRICPGLFLFYYQFPRS